MRTVVTGVYRDTKDVSKAVARLMDAHFEPDHIRIEVETSKGRHEVPLEYRSPWAGGAIIGAVAGVVLGAIGSALVATGVLPEPGMGLLTGGVVAATLKGAFVAGAMGALSGYIVALAIWSSDPQIRAEELDGGRVFVRVSVMPHRVKAVKEVLLAAGSEALEPDTREDPPPKKVAVQ